MQEHKILNIKSDIERQQVDIETPNVNKASNSVDILSDENLNHAARESIKAQEEMHEEALQEAYKRGYIDGGLDEIVRSNQAVKTVANHISDARKKVSND